MRSLLVTFTALALLAGACSNGQGDPPVRSDAIAEEPESEAADTAAEDPDGQPTTVAPDSAPRTFPPAPEVTTGPLAEDVATDLDLLFDSLTSEPDLDALTRLANSGDARVAWLMTDIMRFASPTGPLGATLAAAWMQVTGTTVDPGRSIWGTTTDHLIAWDIPAPPGYVGWKRIIFELIESGWRPFFADADAAIDWRHVSWGGVLIDDRELDQTDGFCIDGCIPALNDPALVRAGSDDDWLDDDFPVFGVVVEGEAIALPKNIMQIHEMVNMTLGGRRLGIPYCTLCGSAQAYFTDVIDELPSVDGLEPLEGQPSLELRTSGLLIRSNKVMYEFHTKSVFDTFTGEAVSGPLQDTGLQLEQTSVLATTWGAWKDTHPTSWLIAEDGGIGRFYPPDPLAGRDDDGPIFPIGEADDRLAVQTSVVAVIAPDGTPVAFSRVALDRGDGIATLAGVTVEASGGGYVARADDGAELATHEAFWFAWSQFHPDTALWVG